MTTVSQIERILSDVKFHDYTFDVIDGPSGLYLQLRFKVDGKEWKGRKWQLSTHMTRSEIVQTALKAVLTAVEHEAREKFLYRGRAIFGPHLNVDKLHGIAEELDVR